MVGNAGTQNVAQQRTERTAKLHAEMEKRKLQQEIKTVPTQQPGVIHEGESHGDAGSMMYDSSEGECICDPELEHEREIKVEPESVYANQIGREPLLDFSSKGILQGVVMNEILTRPTQRRR